MTVDRVEVVLIYVVLTGSMLILRKLVELGQMAWRKKRTADSQRVESRVYNLRGPQRNRNRRNAQQRRGRRNPAGHNEHCPLVNRRDGGTPRDIVELANEISSNRNWERVFGVQFAKK